MRFLHSSDIVGERSLLVGMLGGVESQKFSQDSTILAVFMDTKLEILGERFIECFAIRENSKWENTLELIFVLCNLLEEFKTLLHKMFPDDL